MKSTVKVRQLAVGGFDDNFSYLATADNGDAFMVDPCGDAAVIRHAVETAGRLTPRYILITHRHNDHISALSEVKSFFPAPVIEHANLHDRQLLPFGVIAIEALFTPGHTPDSVCYRLTDDSALFTGDTLFIDCCGYCEPRSMYHSLHEVLKPLAGSNLIYSGHHYGHVPFESLEKQRRSNPYLTAPDYPQFVEALKDL